MKRKFEDSFLENWIWIFDRFCVYIKFYLNLQHSINHKCDVGQSLCYKHWIIDTRSENKDCKSSNLLQLK